MTDRPRNWAGNITYAAQTLHRPTSVSELQAVVAASDRIRALGTGHSFNRLADSEAALVSVADLPPTVRIDGERATVTAAAGVRYGELARQLYDSGYALANLGSLPHISIAGACATATHGSGVTNGNLATSVVALELVGADGEMVVVRRDGVDAAFFGTVVSLGALGVVTSVTLDIEPAFDIRQYVYDDLPEDRLAQFDEIMSSAYSVSLFTDWGSGSNQVWVKSRSDDAFAADPHWFGATLADGPRHPVPGRPVVNCTQQLGVLGPWHERLSHFRLEFTPSSGEELQTEYLVPRPRALEALAAVSQIRDLVAPVLQISEIRTVAADELWLSPSYGRDTVGIHFTWVPDGRAVAPVVAAVERQLAPMEARPHWGKVFGISPEVVRRLYERAPDFVSLLRKNDPAGKFRNAFLDRYFPADG